MALLDNERLLALAKAEIIAKLGYDPVKERSLANTKKLSDYANAVRLTMGKIQYDRLERTKLYPHQMRMFEKEQFTIVNGVMAANRSGKTFGVCYALACHLTGWYPDWWRDIKYTTGVKITCAGASSDQIKEAFQESLFGTLDKRYKDSIGTGLIPRANIVMESLISGHSASEVKECRFLHKSGTESSIKFVSFEQSRDVLQGGKNDIVAIDEQPPDELVSELMRGIAITPSGQSPRVYMSFTPLKGRTPLVANFLDGKPQYSHCTYTWDDLPQELLPDETRAALMSTYLPWEVAARTRGIPSQGEGAVFQVLLRECTYDPSQIMIAPHYKRIVGMDFGRSPDPTTGVYVAWDKDTDIIYIYDSFEVHNQTPVEYQAQLTSRGMDIPIAWPCDGKRKGYTETSSVVDELRYKYNLKLLSQSFTNPDGGNSIDYGLQYMLQRLRTGRLVINVHLEQLLREMENYHTERTGINGKLNFRGKDHLIDAARLACLSVERYGISKLDCVGDPDQVLRYIADKRFVDNFTMNTY